MAKMFKNIGEKIIPETKFLFLRTIPIGLLILSPIFVAFITIREMTVFKNDYEMWLYAFLSSFVGIYIARFIAFVVKKNIMSQSMVKADVYYEEEN